MIVLFEQVGVHLVLQIFLERKRKGLHWKVIMFKMLELKQIYQELVNNRDFMNTTREVLEQECKKQGILAGLSEIVCDFFFEIKGYDLSDEKLGKVYALMHESFQINGDWMLTEDAKKSGAWRETRLSVTKMIGI